MKTVKKVAVNPDTDQQYWIEMPGPESVRQAILKMDFPQDGIKVKDAARILAETFSLSDEQTWARNSSNLNFFQHNIVSPQFKLLLEAGQLKQPGGPRTPYFLAESSSDLSDTELHETFPEYIELAKRITVDPDTGKEKLIKLPPTHVVKKALLGFDYPTSGIQIKDIVDALADQFELSDEKRKARGKYGSVWRRHVNITANSLVNSGQLLRIKRGWYINPEQPDVETSDLEDTSPFSDGETLVPEVVIAQNYRDHIDRLKEDLLQKIVDNPPDFFEKLVLDLLVKMEYGNSHTDAKVVGRSGDGGIDGIINQDPLGLDVIYIQAKQWTDGKVSRPDIQRFIGALTGTGASKGVFITTSSFTEPAKEAANESAGPKIVLVDGKQLVQLMIDHHLGISLGSLYQLKEVDVAYFTIDDAGDAG